MFRKRNLASLVAEFLGSGVLTLVVVGVQHSTIGVPYFVGVAAGLAAALMVFVFGAVSGAQLNPVITLALWTIRRVSTVRAVLYIAVQLLGAWVAYYVFTYHINSKLTPVGSGFSGRVLLAEAIGTAVLAFGWSATVYQRYTLGLKATAIGISYAMGVVIASAASIGLINPAVALADRAWVWGTYVLGPVLGALIGANLYALLFAEGARFWVSARTAVPAGTSAAAVRTPAASTSTRGKSSRAKSTSKRRATSKRK